MDATVWTQVCSLDDLWAGEMGRFHVEGIDILVIHTDDGQVVACPGECPHQASALDDGILEGRTLTCTAHLWTFDLDTGQGIRPTNCSLTLFPTSVKDNQIYVDVKGNRTMGKD